MWVGRWGFIPRESQAVDKVGLQRGGSLFCFVGKNVHPSIVSSTWVGLSKKIVVGKRLSTTGQLPTY